MYAAPPPLADELAARPPIENDTGISELLLKPEYNSSKLVIRKPITIEEEVYVESETHPHYQLGKELMRQIKENIDNGTVEEDAIIVELKPLKEIMQGTPDWDAPYFVKQTVKVYAGMTSQEINLPIPNLFKSDLSSAMLGEQDVWLITDLINLYAYIVQLSFATGEDYSTDLYKLYNLIGGILNTSGARGGRKAELAKTIITKGEAKSWVYQQQIEKEKKKKRFVIF